MGGTEVVPDVLGIEGDKVRNGRCIDAQEQEPHVYSLLVI